MCRLSRLHAACAREGIARTPRPWTMDAWLVFTTGHFFLLNECMESHWKTEVFIEKVLEKTQAKLA